MRDFNVMINQQERERKIIDDSKVAIKNKELAIHSDEKLLREVWNLVEKPYLFLAQFRDDYLKLPEEILITTMKKNQKYFPLYNSKNKLSNYFLLVSNINPSDNGVKHHRRQSKSCKCKIRRCCIFLEKRYKT